MPFAVNFGILKFYIATMEEIYVSDEARYENYEQAKLIQNHLIETYKGYEYDLIEVPKTPLITEFCLS
jgi:predicted ATPase